MKQNISEQVQSREAFSVFPEESESEGGEGKEASTEEEDKDRDFVLHLPEYRCPHRFDSRDSTFSLLLHTTSSLDMVQEYHIMLSVRSSDSNDPAAPYCRPLEPGDEEYEPPADAGQPDTDMLDPPLPRSPDCRKTGAPRLLDGDEYRGYCIRWEAGADSQLKT